MTHPKLELEGSEEAIRCTSLLARDPDISILISMAPLPPRNRKCFHTMALCLLHSITVHLFFANIMHVHAVCIAHNISLNQTASWLLQLQSQALVQHLLRPRLEHRGLQRNSAICLDGLNNTTVTHLVPGNAFVFTYMCAPIHAFILQSVYC